MAPTPPSSNRPHTLLDSTSNLAFWEQKAGSRKHWLITDHSGNLIPGSWLDGHLQIGESGFTKKKSAVAAWREMAGKRQDLIALLFDRRLFGWHMRNLNFVRTFFLL